MINNIEIVEFDHGMPLHAAAAEELAELSAKSSLLPLNPQAIEKHPLKLIAVEVSTQKFAGYIAITGLPLPEMAKMGGLFVPSDMRRYGVGSLLTGRMLDYAISSLPQLEIITAIVNPNSKRLFQEFGATAVGEKSVYWNVIKSAQPLVPVSSASRKN